MSVTANYSGNVVLADGFTSSGTQFLTLTGNAGTASSLFLQCTTPSLSTAAAGSQAEVITIPGVTANNLADVTYAGGTNTVANITFKAICTANTVTVTITNNSAGALNGTLIFNLVIN